MEPTVAFKNLLQHINAKLKNYGFKKQGTNFYKQLNNNIGLISFQKSIKNTSTDIFFAINLGIYSSAIMNVIDSDKLTKTPNIANCHWQQRLTNSPQNSLDQWWTINENTDINSLYRELEDLLINEALSSINNLLDDAKLLILWQSKYPDHLEFRSKLYLAILFKKSGKMREFQSTMDVLEKETDGKPTRAFFNIIKRKLLNTSQ